MRLTAKHLELYKKVSERGEGRCSSDLAPEESELLTPDQWKEMSKAFHDWNGDPKTFLERTNFVLPDFCVLSYLRFLILNEVKKQLPKTYEVVIEFKGHLTVVAEGNNQDEASENAVAEFSKLNRPGLQLGIFNMTTKELEG